MGMGGAIDVEQAHYSVIKQTTHYEVRLYAPVMAIATEMNDDKKQFKNLAGYIGVMGEPMNDAHKAISMTAPVVTDTQKMNQDNTPQPLNNDVHIEKIKERTMVVQTFSGSIDMKGAAEKAQKLAELANEEGL